LKPALAGFIVSGREFIRGISFAAFHSRSRLKSPQIGGNPASTRLLRSA